MAAKRIARHRACLVERPPEGHDLRKCRKHHRETAVGLRLEIDRVAVGFVPCRRCHLALVLRLHQG